MRAWVVVWIWLGEAGIALHGVCLWMASWGMGEYAGKEMRRMTEERTPPPNAGKKKQ